MMPSVLCTKSYVNEKNVNNEVPKDSPIGWYLSLILITSLGSDNNDGLLHRSSYVTIDCIKLSVKTKHRRFKIEQHVFSF